MTRDLLDGQPSNPRPQRNCWAPGDYSCTCTSCGEEFTGDKRAVTCADCAYTCSFCLVQEVDMECPAPFCATCFDSIVIPAYAHVTATPTSSPGGPLWRGREAFIAGAAHYKKLIEAKVVSDGCL